MKDVMFNTKNQVHQVLGQVKSEKEFSINTENSGVIIRSLTKNLYRSPLEGTFRELISNAVDSARKSGVKKILINFPVSSSYGVKADVAKTTFHERLQAIYDDLYGSTSEEVKEEITNNYNFDMERCLVIRDYGTGIEPEIFEDLYTSLFSSTKREDDNAIGYFGLGSKSPFSLSDSFDVINFYEGIRYQYNVSLLEDSAKMVLVSSGETNEPNGLCVSVPLDNAALNNSRNLINLGISKVISGFKDIDFSFNDNAEIIDVLYEANSTNNVPDLNNPIVFNNRERDIFYLGNVAYYSQEVELVIDFEEQNYVGNTHFLETFFKDKLSSIDLVSLYPDDYEWKTELNIFSKKFSNILNQFKEVNLFNRSYSLDYLLSNFEVLKVAIPPSRDNISIHVKLKSFDDLEEMFKVVKEQYIDILHSIYKNIMHGEKGVVDKIRKVYPTIHDFLDNDNTCMLDIRSDWYPSNYYNFPNNIFASSSILKVTSIIVNKWFFEGLDHSIGRTYSENQRIDATGIYSDAKYLDYKRILHEVDFYKHLFNVHYKDKIDNVENSLKTMISFLSHNADYDFIKEKEGVVISPSVNTYQMRNNSVVKFFNDLNEISGEVTIISNQTYSAIKYGEFIGFVDETKERNFFSSPNIRKNIKEASIYEADKYTDTLKNHDNSFDLIEMAKMLTLVGRLKNRVGNIAPIMLYFSYENNVYKELRDLKVNKINDVIEREKETTEKADRVYSSVPNPIELMDASSGKTIPLYFEKRGTLNKNTSQDYIIVNKHEYLYSNQNQANTITESSNVYSFIPEKWHDKVLVPNNLRDSRRVNKLKLGNSDVYTISSKNHYLLRRDTNRALKAFLDEVIVTDFKGTVRTFITMLLASNAVLTIQELCGYEVSPTFNLNGITTGICRRTDNRNYAIESRILGHVMKKTKNKKAKIFLNSLRLISDDYPLRRYLTNSQNTIPDYSKVSAETTIKYINGLLEENQSSRQSNDAIISNLIDTICMHPDIRDFLLSDMFEDMVMSIRRKVMSKLSVNLKHYHELDNPDSELAEVLSLVLESMEINKFEDYLQSRPDSTRYRKYFAHKMYRNFKLQKGLLNYEYE